MQRRRTSYFLAIAIIWATLGATAPPARADGASEEFENRVRPALLTKCGGCHGPRKQENGLRVDSRAALLQGGASGPAIVAGDAQSSRLWQAVARQGDVQMPPDEPLADAEVAAIARWIDAGAAWPEADAPVGAANSMTAARSHWSFQPLNFGALLVASQPQGDSSPIDFLLRARWTAAGLSPAAPAPPTALLRRVAYDLTGLPPSAEEVEAFLADRSQTAYEKVVDRLLATPQYGQRWGRHWLDVVRYADTAGETADFPAPLAYRYRDYVIDALNSDKPFDAFVREQIAGDLLAATGPRVNYAERVTATGFLAVSRRFGFDSENYHHLTIQDTIDTLGQALLGLSLGCARCHDHKFDPVTMRDYYGLYGIFASTQYAFPGSEEKKRPRDLVPLVPPAEATALRQAHAEQLAALERDVQALDARLAELKAADADQASTAVKSPELVSMEKLRGETAARRDELNLALPYEAAYAVSEGTPHDERIQIRGEPTRPGDEAPRRWLEIFGGTPLPADETGSGRRELADWITVHCRDLTARVIVNRVWQHHFGRGLVDTPNDFGRRGKPPTHPELLDYLAQRLMASRWSLKTLHREILLSQAYRRSTAARIEDAAADPENVWYARFSRRPLSAEELRDTLLQLGGELDLAPGGEHSFPPVSQWNYSQHTPFVGVYPSNRRSVYLMVQRIKRHPYLALFDGPDPNASTAVRSRSYVPTQALYLLNGEEIHAQSENYARRLMSWSDPRQRFRAATLQTLGRLPTAAESEAAAQFLAEYGAQLSAATFEPAPELACWAALARGLWCQTEFLFVE